MKRHLPWLAAALALFVAASLLMRDPGASTDVPEIEKHEVYFPRFMKPAEYQRSEKRRTLPPRDPTADGSQKRNRDPLLSALPSLATGKMAVVVEANAIRNSPLGEMLIDCMGTEDMGDVQERLGIDPLTDLDRVAVSGETLMFSGSFAGFTPEKLKAQDGSTSRRYGTDATIYERPEGQGPTLAVWKDELIIAGKSREEVEAAIDRVEGRRDQDGPPPIPEHLTYGEVYGALTADALAKLIPPEQSALADRLREVAQHIELHADTTNDVGVVLSVGGGEERDVGDLAQSIGGALALARLTASREEEKNLVELLDLARVVPRGNSFTVEMALPLAVIQKQLEGCKSRQQPPP